jgi:hypothetical protein
LCDRRWQQLHTAFNQLLEGAELIETATPRSTYELTRRKLGMVGGLPWGAEFWTEQAGYETTLPNVFVVGDTTAHHGIEGITRSAWILANHLTT